MNRLLQIPEVAHRLNVSVHRAYELARQGRIPCVRLGRQVRVDADRLESFIRDGGVTVNEIEPGDA